MKRVLLALVLLLLFARVDTVLADGFELPAEPPARESSGPDPAPEEGDLATPAFPLESQPHSVWLGNCSRYGSCVCNCEYQRSACLQAFLPNCWDQYYACHDDCIRWVADGTQCGVITC
jgi:hypothetical protein